MKALFIAFDQAHYEDVYNVLTHNNCRGFTYWQDVQGRGTKSGEPHYGSHAWPSMNSAILSVVDETRLGIVLKALHTLDEAKPALGLRAFVWDIEKAILIIIVSCKLFLLPIIYRAEEDFCLENIVYLFSKICGYENNQDQCGPFA